MGRNEFSEDLIERAQRIKLLLMDCDGVLTDGRLYYSEKGEVLKVFHVRDGQGLVSWHRAGFRSGIISGRNAREILVSRAAELGIDYVKSGSQDKTRDFEDILQTEKITSDEVAYIGDDIGDICLLKRVGMPIAVADADEQVLPYVLFITRKKGGYGAVREVINLLLEAKNLQTKSF